MAKIKIKGIPEMFEVSEEKAKNIKADLLNTGIPNNQKMNIDGSIITKGDIVGVFSDKERHYEDRTYNLENPEEKKLVWEFDRNLAGRKFLDYCIDEGFITAEKEEMPGGPLNDNKPYTRYKNITIIEPVTRYEEVNKLNASLDKLKGRREWAKENEPLPNPEGQMAYAALKNEIMPEDLGF